MIRKIEIKNFKSVVDLSLDLGYFNVLIGENGCGKSNILEAIAFGAAAEARKLDSEFLGSRGIRMSNPDFMFSAFSQNESKVIKLEYWIDETRYYFDLIYDSQKKWIEHNFEHLYTEIESSHKKLQNDLEKIKLFNESIKTNAVNDPKIVEEFNERYLRVMTLENEINSRFEKFNSFARNSELSNFIIYSPEFSSLKKFEETTQILPLGIKGEGVFQHLRELLDNQSNKTAIREIKSILSLLDWYDDFNLPDGLLSNEYYLKIKDRYVEKNIDYFDQRSTNEGFLFLLFYSLLFVSKDTPKFFSIDNIENSFNPKLCRNLIINLAKLAKKHNKQVIVTTHSPAVLDGLDLEDDGQRLFVVRRNEEGHTKAKRVPHKSERELNLSEIWNKGFIGGLPENF